MKQLFIQPVDTFFFRNQKDFTPGVNSMAASVFPPRPGTVYGALRSAYINQYSTFEQFRTGCEGQVKEWMGTPVKPGRFRLRGCFLHDQQQPILPLPLDYQVVETEHLGEAAEIAYPLKLTLDEVPASDGRQYRLYGVRNEKSGSSAGAYLPLPDWKRALLEPSSVHIYRSSHWMIQEDKLGIARDWATRTAREGMLYQIKTNRFIDAKEPARSPGLLAVCTDAPDFSEISLVRLGGRNRPWALKSIPDEFGMFKAKEERLIEERIASSQIARLILLTPAIWREDSSFYQQQAGVFQLRPGLSFPVLAEAIGRPVLVGGWDIVRNAPKPRIQAVPAGTVLYLRVSKEQASALVQGLKETMVSDELAYEGYGWAVCGPVKL
jgi:CRISPR-associated protein Cmr3